MAVRVVRGGFISRLGTPSPPRPSLRHFTCSLRVPNLVFTAAADRARASPGRAGPSAGLLQLPARPGGTWTWTWLQWEDESFEENRVYLLSFEFTWFSKRALL